MEALFGEGAFWWRRIFWKRILVKPHFGGSMFLWNNILVEAHFGGSEL